MLVAVPSESPGGLDAEIADHFGHCAAFTLVELTEGQVGEVTVLPNGGHEQGGCMAPVRLLKEREVEALVAGGMGRQPLAGFQQVGIRVFHNGDASTVREAIELMTAGKCPEFAEQHTCGGGCSGHAHHHAPVDRPPLEGPADVRKDRVVSVHYTLTEKGGAVVESSDGEDPLRYLHGHDNLVPRLEAALAGLEPGARRVVELTAADAYGERDEAKVLDVPRDRVPPEVVVGSQLRGRDPSGGLMALTVVDISDDSVRLDGNHPLAGKDLVFDVTVVSVEAAVPEELEHGHVH
jgi:FKBP-type peptidyl-prolyl cis-trans isomerase 2/predicted Fe-Mo cluster-binding NifX family protein